MAKKTNIWNWVEKVAEDLGITDRLKKKMKKEGISDENIDEASRLTDEFFDGNTSSEDEQKIKNAVGTNIFNTGKLGRDLGIGIGNAGTQAKEWIDAYTGKDANDTNREIAEENRDFQRETFEYEKGLQEEIFNREDTAYQRTVNDMRLAGLNPLNMQNTNGAGQAVAVTTPKNEYTASPTRHLDALNMLFNAAQQSIATNANKSLSQAQANLLNTQADNQRIKNIYEADILANTLTGMRYDNTGKNIDLNNKYENYLFNQLTGWTENMPDWLKQSSARLGYKPYKHSNISNFAESFADPDSYWYRQDFNGKLNPDLSAKLLGDELLTGSLGIFGNILKLLMK